MGLIKLASIILKSPTSFGTCLTELPQDLNSYHLGCNRDKYGNNEIHAFGKKT